MKYRHSTLPSVFPLFLPIVRFAVAVGVHRAEEGTGLGHHHQIPLCMVMVRHVGDEEALGSAIVGGRGLSVECFRNFDYM